MNLIMIMNLLMYSSVMDMSDNGLWIIMLYPTTILILMIRKWNILFMWVVIISMEMRCGVMNLVITIVLVIQMESSIEFQHNYKLTIYFYNGSPYDFNSSWNWFHLIRKHKVRMMIHDCDIYNWRQEIDDRVEYWIQELVQDNQQCIEEHCKPNNRKRSVQLQAC